MYPYVSAATAAAAHHHHQQQQQAAAAAAFGAAASSAGSMVPGGFSSSPLADAAAAAAAAAADKSCRYTGDAMVNYGLGHHHQNGGATPGSVSAAASASIAQFYHQAAAVSAGVDPLGPACAQPPGGAPAGQAIPDIPRYPWMSITGNYRRINEYSFYKAYLAYPKGASAVKYVLISFITRRDFNIKRVRHITASIKFPVAILYIH